MIEADQGAVRIEQDRDAVEAQLGAEGAPQRLREPGDGHPAHLGLLDEVQVLPGLARVGPPGLDLDEDERGAVEHDQIELAEARPVVAGEHLEAEALEMLGGDVLAALARRMPDVGHGLRRYAGNCDVSARRLQKECDNFVPTSLRRLQLAGRPVNHPVMRQSPSVRATYAVRPPRRGFARPDSTGFLACAAFASL